MSALKRIKQQYHDRHQPALEWKRKGGKVIGYLGVDVPEELLIAADFFPIRINPDPSSATDLADKYFRKNFNPVLKSIFNRILDGTYAFLDHLIIPNSSESILQLFYVLREIKRLESYDGMPDFYFFDFLHTKFHTSNLYNRDRVNDLKQVLENWNGKKITDENIRPAITICNKNRRLLNDVAKLRTTETPRITGVEALKIIGASMFMDKEEHNLLLSQLIEESHQLPKHQGVKLFIEGSSIDSTEIYHIIESSGAIIVGEDSDWGDRYFDTLVDDNLDPIRAITDRYQFKAPTPQKSTIDQRVEYCVRKVQEARADGVVFYIIEGENPPSWDYPEQQKALEELGIATLVLPWQSYHSVDVEGLKSNIQTFVNSISFKNTISTSEGK